MRQLLLLVVMAGCFGTLDPNGRPAVIPKLSELPSDPAKRDAVLDQARETAGPEHRKGMTKKERRAETLAAFAAAIVGEAFSSSHSVTLGSSTTIDENAVFEKSRRARPSGTGADAGAGSGAPPEPPPDASQLTPWVKLK